MKLPEEERAVLNHAIVNLQGGLSYQGALSKLIEDVRGKVYKLPGSRYTVKSTPGELQLLLREQVKDIINALDVVEENRIDLLGHADKARSIVDMINNGVFDYSD